VCIDPHQTGFVGKGGDHLKLIKFWPSRAPGKGGQQRGDKRKLRGPRACRGFLGRGSHRQTVFTRFSVQSGLSRQFSVAVKEEFFLML